MTETDHENGPRNLTGVSLQSSHSAEGTASGDMAQEWILVRTHGVTIGTIICSVSFLRQCTSTDKLLEGNLLSPDGAQVTRRGLLLI